MVKDKELRKRLSAYYLDHSEYRKCGKMPNWLYEKIGSVEPLAVYIGAKQIGMRDYAVIYHNGLAKRYFDEHNPKLKRHLERVHPELLDEKTWSIFTPELNSETIENILNGRIVI